jgi:hypothetical protein
MGFLEAAKNNSHLYKSISRNTSINGICTHGCKPSSIRAAPVLVETEPRESQIEPRTLEPLAACCEITFPTFSHLWDIKSYTERKNKEERDNISLMVRGYTYTVATAHFFFFD